MARRPRVEFASAFYHVICRGNQRQKIFRDDTDRRRYLELLEQPWLDTTEVLRQFSRTVREAKRLYRKFVWEGMDEGHKEEYYEVLDGRFLGDRQFAEGVKSKTGARGSVCYVGRSCTELSVKALAEMLGVDATCVSRSVARTEGRLRTDKRLEGTLERIISAIGYYK